MTKPKNWDASVAPTTAQTAYALRGITYLQHYRHSGLYVSPGTTNAPPIPKAYSAGELERAGATKITLQLWGRA